MVRKIEYLEMDQLFGEKKIIFEAFMAHFVQYRGIFSILKEYLNFIQRPKLIMVQLIFTCPKSMIKF